MDIKQAVDACAALTLGKDMVFRDYAQGAFRMRGIGKGQNIRLLVVPEILSRIQTQVAIGASGNSAAPLRADQQDAKQFLNDVVSWLVINSMRVDGVQYNLLCEQSVANIWRKRCFLTLRSDFRSIDNYEQCPPALNRALTVFRERIDFEIENSIAQSTKYSEKINKAIKEHRWVAAVVIRALQCIYLIFAFFLLALRPVTCWRWNWTARPPPSSWR